MPAELPTGTAFAAQLQAEVRLPLLSANKQPFTQLLAHASCTDNDYFQVLICLVLVLKEVELQGHKLNGALLFMAEAIDAVLPGTKGKLELRLFSKDLYTSMQNMGEATLSSQEQFIDIQTSTVSAELLAKGRRPMMYYIAPENRG